MKRFSEIDLLYVKPYIGVELSYTLDDEIIESFIKAARDFVVNTNIWTAEELDASDVPVLLLMRLVKQEYTDTGVAVNGKMDPVFTMYQDSMRSCEF